MFDHLSRGRFQMGIGQGSLSSDVELFGVGGGTDRLEMVRESIEHILAIWSGEPPYRRSGRFWDVTVDKGRRLEFGVGEFIKPHQLPHPPIATSIMSPRSASARMAGEYGWIPISSAAFLHARHTASHWEVYVEGAEAAGRTADPDIWRVVRTIVVAPSDEEALDHVLDPEGPLSFWFRYVLSAMRARGALELLAPAGHPDPDSLTWQEVAEEQVTWGAPETVIDELEALRHLTGPFGVLTAMAVEWQDPDFGRRSMRLLAEEVVPELSRRCDTDRSWRRS
jgi:alkanesulfonate monooxygenase SsuD/methylene tetrahydromethanopterin reductase-like flavin-dependent oxidoreductase (luciferase family)